MKEFEQQANLDEMKALSYVGKLQWHQKEAIARQLSTEDLMSIAGSNSRMSV